MKMRLVAPAILVCLLSSCGGKTDPAKSVLISVDVSQKLETVVTITEIRGRRPGKTHLVEAAITVRNDTSKEQRMTAKGIWRDTRSIQYGGFEMPLTLAPKGSETIRQSTNAEKVTILNFFLRPAVP